MAWRPGVKNMDVDIEQTRQEILKELDPNFNAQEESPPTKPAGRASEKKGKSRRPPLRRSAATSLNRAERRVDRLSGARTNRACDPNLCRRTKNNPVLFARLAWERRRSSRVGPGNLKGKCP